MPETKEKARARTRAHVAKRRAGGWLRLDAFLDPDTAAQLETLRTQTGENRAEIITRLIAAEFRREHLSLTDGVLPG